MHDGGSSVDDLGLGLGEVRVLLRVGLGLGEVPVGLMPWPPVARPYNRPPRTPWATPACGPPQYLRKSSPEYNFRLGIHRFAREPERPGAWGGSPRADDKIR